MIDQIDTTFNKQATIASDGKILLFQIKSF